MKICTLSLALACALSLAAAQAEPTPTPTPAAAKPEKAAPEKAKPAKMDKAEKLKAELGLTDDQVIQIRSIEKETQSEANALKQDQSLDKDARRAKAMDIRKESEERIAAILTPEQKVKWEELKKTKKPKKDAPAAPAPAATN